MHACKSACWDCNASAAATACAVLLAAAPALLTDAAAAAGFNKWTPVENFTAAGLASSSSVPRFCLLLDGAAAA